MFGCQETRTVSDIKKCINDQKLAYGDLCAENSEPHTYYNGVKCGAEGVRHCLQIYNEIEKYDQGE